ncbi:AMP-binding protein [Pseudoalteromonas tunicata]|uniref:AMP-binding protein n=1 Tax=Pseudoalteromonas tunicata TaxID=314281 RepID=UPI00273E8F87|nr:AMP-binding protein [Pseudoalteromonas tunicata]MDP4984869.1 AMP-binding protein [Pseudoalteromonas tunicata]MDP5213852.1 AMP-binding protein [Pseudoalteromonas tunicata]
MSLIDSISQFETRIALDDGECQLSYEQLIEAVHVRSRLLTHLNVQTLALHIDNCIEWILFDLAAQQANITIIPVPLFFTESQIKHLIESSAVDCFISEQINNDISAVGSEVFVGFGRTLFIAQLMQSDFGMRPNGTQKVTFTSGSTGLPKGVCLSVENQTVVAHSLVDAIALKAPKHLCLLPLSVLLENIAGVYAPLLAGGTVTLVSLEALGFNGTKLVEPNKLLMNISRAEPNSLILVPELLLLLVNAIKAGWTAPTSLKFIAVGGAKVACDLLEEAHRLGLPVYQGYGLSECGSVVSLNTPLDCNHASAGKVLPHCQVYEVDGELVVCGNCHLGYQNDPDSWFAREFKTGDLAVINDDFLIINGRKKNLIISSFGRNIAPEWPESLLQATGLFYQAVVLGEERPFCIALLVPIKPMDEANLSAAINKVNAQLPDYAKVRAYEVLSAPMSQIDNLYTANNRPKRTEIATHFAAQVNALYASKSQCAEPVGSALESL